VLDCMREWYEVNVAAPERERAKKSARRRESYHAEASRHPVRASLTDLDVDAMAAVVKLAGRYHMASFQYRFIRDVLVRPAQDAVGNEPTRDGLRKLPITEGQLAYIWKMCRWLSKRWTHLDTTHPCLRVIRIRRRAMLIALRDGVDWRPAVMLPEDHYV
jgi:hypothetical protein